MGHGDNCSRLSGDEKMNIALIGAGIAGELTAFLLLRAGHEVTLYDPGHVRGPASWNSTGVVGSFGTRRGYGLLGDLLVDALPVARKFYEDFNHPSVLEASLHYLSYNGDENFHRRFQHLPKGLSLEGQDIDTGLPKVSQQVFREQGQLIDCQGFMGELRRRNNQSPLCMRVQRYITSREQVSGHSLVLYPPPWGHPVFIAPGSSPNWSLAGNFSSVGGRVLSPDISLRFLSKRCDQLP